MVRPTTDASLRRPKLSVFDRAVAEVDGGRAGGFCCESRKPSSAANGELRRGAVPESDALIPTRGVCQEVLTRKSGNSQKPFTARPNPVAGHSRFATRKTAPPRG